MTVLLVVLAAGLGVIAAGHVVCYKRDHRAAMLWVALIAFLPGVGAAAYFLLGINRIHRRAMILRQRRQDAHGASLAAAAASPPPVPRGVPAPLQPLARAIGGLTGKALLTGNRVEPLINGDAAYPEMLAAIESAQHSITLSSYLFGADELGLSFVTALGAAVRRQVEVRVLIDGSNFFLARSGVLRALKAARVPHATFLPLFRQWPPVTLNLRNHRKILVVDGRVGFTGGMNILAAHCLQKRPPHPVADVQFRIEGPVVAHLQDAFADDWLFTTGEVLTGDHWFPPLNAAGTMFARGIASGPDERLELLRWGLLAAIAGARRSLRILTPYFVPDPPLISALNVARRTGVAVEVVLPLGNDVPFAHWASASQWWQLLEHGCRLWLAPAPFDHTKVFIVDESWCLVGSSNWDARSLRLNFEFDVEVYDPGLAEQLVAQFETRRQAAREVTLAEMDGRPPLQRLRDGLARLAAPFL